MRNLDGITPVTRLGLPKLPTYIGQCCREWVMPISGRPGRCGICGEQPTFLREDKTSA